MFPACEAERMRLRRRMRLWRLSEGGCCQQAEAYLLRCSVGSLDTDAAEPEHAASAAAGRQQLLHQRLVLLLQGQHEPAGWTRFHSYKCDLEPRNPEKTTMDVLNLTVSHVFVQHMQIKCSF